MSEKIFNMQFTASRRLFYLMGIMHMLALVAVWQANLPMLVALILTASLLLSAVIYGRDFADSNANSGRLQYVADDGWRLAIRDNSLLPITIKQCFISQPLIIINYQQTGKAHSLRLLSDSANADALRKCRILLRQKV